MIPNSYISVQFMDMKIKIKKFPCTAFSIGYLVSDLIYGVIFCESNHETETSDNMTIVPAFGGPLK